MRPKINFVPILSPLILELCPHSFWNCVPTHFGIVSPASQRVRMRVMSESKAKSL